MDDRTGRISAAGIAAGKPSIAERLRARRPGMRQLAISRALIGGLVLLALAIAWWAATYSQATGTVGASLFDAVSCFGFQTQYCAGFIRADSTTFVYSHLLFWLAGIFILVGLWRSSALSRKPPKWILPFRITIFRLFALGIMLLLWWEASRAIGVRFPNPYQTLLAAGDLFREPQGRLGTAFFESLNVYLRGMAYAAVVGIPIGLILGGFKIVGRTMDVFVNGIMATPRVAFIPLIIFFLSIGPEAKIFIIFLGAVMPIIANTYAGVRASDGELVEMARSVGARRSQIFVRILLPGALPFIIVGLRIGATIGLINTVVAELYTAATGLGGLLQRFRQTFQMDDYLVVVLSLTLIGVVVTSLLRLLENRMDRWRYDGS
jgi:NitT/TauT family transport system permease protein